MKIIFKILGFFAILLTHMVIAYSFPYPWQLIHSIVISLVMYMIWSESGATVWLAFLLYFCIELYAVQPFGVSLVSMTLAVLIVYYLYQLLFTNKTWYSAIALTATLLVVYRLLYTILLVLFNIFIEDITIAWRELFISFGWELILSMGVSAIVYLIFSRISKRLKTERISHI